MLAKKNEKNHLHIDVKKLRKPKLKPFLNIAFITKLSGRFDAKNGLIIREGINSKISSPWVMKKQACYNRYSAEMYKIAGEIIKEAYIEREQLNDELKQLKRDLEEAEKMIPNEVPETIEQKRKAVYAKKHKESVEAQIAEKSAAMKELKVSIDEAEHELNQILQAKKLIVNSQVLDYIRGAGLIPQDPELMVEENETSRLMYNALGNGFEYCTDMEGIFKCVEKEGIEL